MDGENSHWKYVVITLATLIGGFVISRYVLDETVGGALCDTLITMAITSLLIIWSSSKRRK